MVVAFGSYISSVVTLFRVVKFHIALSGHLGKC